MTRPDSPSSAVALDVAEVPADISADQSEVGGTAPALSKNQKKKAKLKAKKAEAAKEEKEEKTAPVSPSTSDASPASAVLEVKGAVLPLNVEKQKKQEDDAERGDSDDAAEPSADGDAQQAEKKKRRKKKKGKGNGPSSWSSAVIRCIPFYLASPPYNAAGVKPVNPQTSPPTLPVSTLYPSGVYPEGQLLTYPLHSNSHRMGSEEKRALDRVNESLYAEVREAAEVHRQVRQDFQRWVRPGTSMLDIANYIERGTRTLVKADGIARGWGFPTGLSLNHCAAHYTPNSKDTTVLQQSDVMKVDIGVQVNGHIVDCAFTIAFDERYDPLIRTVKDATDAGIKAAGVDVRLCDIGEAVQEVMEAGEVELDGKVYRIKSIKNLNGHSIGRYQIHAGKSIPIVKNQDTTKMEENEFYAIETFGSTGRGLVLEDMECSHYMKVYDEGAGSASRLRTKAAKDLLKHIDSHHGTLAFCRRWLDDAGLSGYLLGLKQLCDADIVRPYPPLVDIKGSYTAQFEHTLYTRPTCLEVISRGEDY